MEAEQDEHDAQGESDKSLENKTSHVTSPNRNYREGNTSPSHEKICHAQHLPWWRDSQWWQVIVAGVLVPFGIYAVIVYAHQLGEMHRSNELLKISTDAATDAARAASKGLEMARLDQRAWLAPFDIRGLPEENKPYNIIVFMKNTGKTFAKRVEIAMGADVVLKGQEPTFYRLNEPAPADRSRGMIAPNAGFSAEYQVNPNVTSDELKIYDSGGKWIYVYGRISYKDIFNCDHWTKFCLVYDGKSGYWPCKQEYANDADNGKCP
jgi:hypothetical protein